MDWQQTNKELNNYIATVTMTIVLLVVVVVVLTWTWTSIVP